MIEISSITISGRLNPSSETQGQLEGVGKSLNG